LKGASRNDRFFETMLRDCVWPINTWIREVLVGLEETSFKTVAPDIHEEIMDFVLGPHSSVPVENCIRAMGQDERQHAASFLSRASRWHSIIASNILQDHERSLPVATAASSTIRAPRLKSATFDFNAVPFSLGDEVLEILKSDRQFINITFGIYVYVLCFLFCLFRLYFPLGL